MIDIHCHPLWGVDDGAESFEESVAMSQMAAADGVTHLVATPHSNYTYDFDPDVNRKKLEELQTAVGETPQLLSGCDFHLSFENIQECAKNPKLFSINGTSYMLVEFPEMFIPEHLDRVFYEIELVGLTPIITHPERNPVFHRKTELVERWVNRGCLVQVTAQSYTGGFGRRAQRLAEDWLDQGLVHFFASDAHDTKHRPPILSKCYQKVAKTKGEEWAECLLRKNPEAVIQGRPLPAQPRLEAEQPRPRKRRWFSFLTG